MNWLLIEDNRLINMDLVTDLRYVEHGLHAGKAVALCGGITMAPESRILGQWYEQKRDEILKAREASKGE